MRFFSKYYSFIKKILPEKFIDIQMRYIHRYIGSHNWKTGKKNDILNNDYQLGGSLEKEFFINYSGHTFRFNILYEQKTTTILVLSSTDDDCVSVEIVKKYAEANIGGISTYANCSEEGLKYPGAGTILLKLILKYLKKNKKELGINRISLQDNSFIKCDDFDKNISLSRLHFVTKGNSWYGKYGFLPYDAFERLPSKKLLKKYKNNNHIFKHLSIDKNWIKKMVIGAVTELKLSNEYVITIDSYVDSDKILLRSFIIMLMEKSKKHKKICKIVWYILEKVFDSDKITDFYHESFYLDI